MERLGTAQLRDDLSRAFHDRIIVTHDKQRLFIYTGLRDQADAVRAEVATDARQRGWSVNITLRRWHPIAEEWRDPDDPLPVDGASKRAERDMLMAHEREETAKRGYPEFEVRIDLPSRRAAVAFCERLKNDGLLAVRRWKYVLVGAADEDSAKTLAKRIRADEAVAVGDVKIEGTWAIVNAERSPGLFSIWSAQ
jgi:hypothetical protein